MYSLHLEAEGKSPQQVNASIRRVNKPVVLGVEYNELHTTMTRGCYIGCLISFTTKSAINMSAMSYEFLSHFSVFNFFLATFYFEVSLDIVTPHFRNTCHASHLSIKH